MNDQVFTITAIILTIGLVLALIDLFKTKN